MLIKYELEAFCNDIEAKLPELSGKAHEKALEKISVLNRVNIEFMEYEDLLRKVALQNSKTQIDNLRMLKDITQLKKDLKTIKENIE